ncbi:ArsR/SmtB family transcription factor [Clostridium sp. DL1XJH146]
MDNEEVYVKIFKALAHPIRINIIKMLKDGSRCVCELNELVEYSQSNLSQHLKILKDVGILKAHKEGLKIIYCIKDERCIELLDLAQQMTMDRIKALNKNI